MSTTHQSITLKPNTHGQMPNTPPEVTETNGWICCAIDHVFSSVCCAIMRINLVLLGASFMCGTPYPNTCDGPR